MKKCHILLIILSLTCAGIYSQQEISSESMPKTFTLTNKSTINIQATEAENALVTERVFMPIEPAPVSGTKRSDAVAIIIGIENYSDLPGVQYAENDARIMEEYFTNTLGIPIVLTFTNEQANWIFFDNMFNLENGELKKRISDGAKDIFIYFSGHGIPSMTGEQIYLLPADGRIDRLSSQGINVTAFFDNLQHIKAQNIVVFFDACFSGMSRQSETIPAENMFGNEFTEDLTRLRDPWINNSSFNIFNSSASNGINLAYDQSMTGLFTYYLCLGLKGEADSNGDRRITAGELQQYLVNNVEQTSKDIGNLQTPLFHGNRNYVLVEF